MINACSFNKGNSAYKEKKYKEAIVFYKKSLEENTLIDFIAAII